MTKTRFPKTTILGYPRVGQNRELKKYEEAYWAGKTTIEELENQAKQLRVDTYKKLYNLGLTEEYAIPMYFSYYDQMHDAAAMSGIIPKRFEYLRQITQTNEQNGRETGSFGERMRRPEGFDEINLNAYFTIARGDETKGIEGLPGEMTKWFDTNYHYIVPEITEDTRPTVSSWEIVRQFEEALEFGYKVRPVLVGPVTLLALAKYENTDYTKLMYGITAVYAKIISKLASKGAKWVQFDEPAIISQTHSFSREQISEMMTYFYNELTELSVENNERPAIFVTTPFGEVDEHLEQYLALNVEAVHFDMVHHAGVAAGINKSFDYSKISNTNNKQIVAGLINGRNIWRADISKVTQQYNELVAKFGLESVSVSSSCSLQHVPHTTQDEQKLQSEFPELLSNLSFADEKITEILNIVGVADDRRSAQVELSQKYILSVTERINSIKDSDFDRESISERKTAQQSALKLPLLPTTTIGSFPQTTHIRQQRALYKKGEITAEQYEEVMRHEIAECVKLQEDLGLDVLVHGEAERNDMVQYFAENFEGFDITENGWVQSYGSRCTKPSILWGDVYRKEAFTVPWISYAASLTDKHMKGMLTGPVTILAWSFVRDDQPRETTANQVALALRDEIEDLEAAGIKIIQVDEPALRELLPLKTAEQKDYLKWSVNSFRLATSSVRVDTQIHTHLCYSEFEVVLSAIIGLNADVTSIEAARSKMEIVSGLVNAAYPLGVGPGVYDIHSPRVPSKEEIYGLLKFAALEFKRGGLPLTDLWVNPDCGLKTRKDEESTPSLKNMCDATHDIRKYIETL